MRTVTAQLNYLARMSARPVFSSDPALTNLELEPHEVEILDARSLAEPPSLEREGLTVARHATALTDFRDPDQVEGPYLREVEDLIRTLTGAAEVRASPGAVARFTDRSDEAKAARTAPAARFVHTDYTDVSARGHFLPQVMDPAEALGRYRRIVVYQTWRALSGPPQDIPLALADGRSVDFADMVTADTVLNDDYGGIGQSFEYSMCRYSPGHRWLYYRDLAPGEVIVFKGYDFDPNRPARLVHTAFDDPSARPHAPPAPASRRGPSPSSRIEPCMPASRSPTMSRR